MSSPDLIDIRPAPGRRVRTSSGDLLPEGNILRGEARSSYWLRLAADGDVTLTPHDARPSAAPSAAPATQPEAAHKKP
jgi:hypothetical protein